MGGLPSPSSLVVRTFTQWSSLWRCTTVRRFFPYVVPHLPRKPTLSPAKRSAGGTLPSLSTQPWVWQSLQLPTTVRYSPACSIDAACTAGPPALGVMLMPVVDDDVVVMVVVV